MKIERKSSLQNEDIEKIGKVIELLKYKQEELKGNQGSMVALNSARSADTNQKLDCGQLMQELHEIIEEKIEDVQPVDIKVEMLDSKFMSPIKNHPDIP